MTRKIMMVTNGLDIGGAETHIVELSKELKRQGYEVVIASNGGIYVEEIEAAGIKHYKVPLNNRKFKNVIRSFFLLRDIILKEQPDVVHAHARIPAFVCGLVHMFIKFPFVTTAHWVFDASGFLRYLTNWGGRTVAVSDDIKDYLMKNYNVREDHIYVTINGIDTNKFSPDVSGQRIIDELGLDYRRPIITHVSRMDSDRALAAERLIQIAPELDLKIKGVQIIIAGGGNRLEELVKKADRANAVAGRQVVYMLGARSDIAEIVAAGDIFVGVSRAALEAMSAEKPTVLAGNEGYGGIFMPQDLEARRETNFCCRECGMIDNDIFINDIVKLIELPPENKAGLGRYCRDVIFKYYSVSKMAGDCIKAYKDVLLPDVKIVLSGYYGYSNSGDEAILATVIKSINKSIDNAKITVLSKTPGMTMYTYGCDAVNRFSIFQVIKAIFDCDVLVSGGGSLFQDVTSTRSLLYYTLLIILAEKLHKKVMIYANGVGPVYQKQSRRITAVAVNKADVITLRDIYSLEELKSMGVWRDDIHITSDPVFMINAAPVDRINEIFDKKGIPQDKPIIMVAIRNWSSIKGFNKKIANMCDKLYENYNCNIVFLAMQIPEDVVISRKTRELMEHPAYLLDDEYSSEELAGIIRKAQFAVTMRLHALIFAAREGVPFVGIVYDPKVKYYLDILEMHQAGTAETFDYIAAYNVAAAVLDNLDEYRERIISKSAELTILANENTKHLIDLVNTVPPKKIKYK